MHERIQRAPRIKGPRNTFLLGSNPDELLAYLNGNAHREWALKQARVRAMREDLGAIVASAEEEAAAESLRDAIRRYAELWVRAEMDLDRVLEIKERVQEFLAKPRLEIVSFLRGAGVPAALVIPTRASRNLKLSAAHEGRMLLLLMVASTWSKRLSLCVCGKYFLRDPRSTAQEPRCSRKCRAKIYNTPKSKRRYEKKRQVKIDATLKAIAALENLPEKKRPRKWKEAVIAAASKSLPPRDRFTVSSLGRWLSTGDIQAPTWARTRRLHGAR